MCPIAICTRCDANARTHPLPCAHSSQRANSIRVLHKRKGRPATGRPSLQGRIVPTEARPSKLSAQILGSPSPPVKQFFGLKLLCFQSLSIFLPSLRKLPEIHRNRLRDPANASVSTTYSRKDGRPGAIAGFPHSPAGPAPSPGNTSSSAVESRRKTRRTQLPPAAEFQSARRPL